MSKVSDLLKKTFVIAFDFERSHVLCQRTLLARVSLAGILFLGFTACGTFIDSNASKKSANLSKNNSQNISTIQTSPKPSPEHKVSINKESNSFKKNSYGFKEPPFFDWPVVEARMTRGWLPRGTKRSRRPHKGIDLAAQRGTAVLSSIDGIVIYTGKDFKGYGKMVMIERDGWATLYAHLDKIVVYEGQKVKQGDVIGALGNTGRSSGPHLHFEIRSLDGPVDPLPLLPAGDALSNDVDNGSEDY